jgi:anti-sigma factor RsiW
MPKVEDDKLARQYLLGELSESAFARIEEQYFEDDEAFERLSAIEDDLIDAYTLGQLSSGERKRFEQRLLLSSAQRERVKFSRTLLRTVSGTGQIESNIPPLKRTASWWTSPFNFLQALNPVVSLSAAAVLFLAVLAGWWLIHRNNVPQEQQAQQTNAARPEQRTQAVNDSAQRVSELPSPTNELKHQEPKQQPVQPPQSNRIVTFALIEGLTRDVSESNRLVIPEDAGQVRLHLTIERNDYRTYRAEVRKAEGGLVRQVRGILPKTTAAGKATVALQVPAHRLLNGDYILTLGGVKGGSSEVVAEYSFRVVRN